MTEDTVVLAPSTPSPEPGVLPQALRSGQVIDGWRLTDCVSQTPSSRVWRGVPVSTDRCRHTAATPELPMVAIKETLQPKRSTAICNANRRAHQTEATLLNKSEPEAGFPRLVEDTTTETGTPVLVMEWVEGASLEELVEEVGPLPWQMVVKIMLQIAIAAAYLHDVQEVIHRDIKPANAMLNLVTGRVRLLDLGICQPPGEPLTDTPTGTPTFMAPEIHRGEDVSDKTDVYSLCALGWTLLMGFAPFAGELTQIGYDVVEGKYVCELRQDIPVQLRDTILRGMSLKVAKRWTMHELIELLYLMVSAAG